MIHTDLHASLTYMTSSDVKRIGESLRSDPSDTQPGWYVRVYANAGYVEHVKYTRISPAGADAIAQTIDQATGFQGEFSGPATQAVRGVNNEHTVTLAKRREAATQAIMAAQATLAAIDAEELCS